jgi:hypothetical protein
LSKSSTRDRLVRVVPDSADGRVKRSSPTASGWALLHRAFPLWLQANRRVDDLLGAGTARDLRRTAEILSSGDFVASFQRGQV